MADRTRGWRKRNVSPSMINIPRRAAFNRSTLASRSSVSRPRAAHVSDSWSLSWIAATSNAMRTGGSTSSRPAAKELSSLWVSGIRPKTDGSAARPATLASSRRASGFPAAASSTRASSTADSSGAWRCRTARESSVSRASSQSSCEPNVLSGGWFRRHVVSITICSSVMRREMNSMASRLASSSQAKSSTPTKTGLSAAASAISSSAASAIKNPLAGSGPGSTKPKALMRAARCPAGSSSIRPRIGRRSWYRAANVR